MTLETVKTILDDFDMASQESRGRNRFVFWDVEDSSILTKVNPKSTAQTIITALGDKGYNGRVLIWAFVELHSVGDAVVEKFASSGIRIEEVVEGGKTARFNTMAATILLVAMNNLREPTCALVLSKDKGFSPVVDALKKNLFQAGLFDPHVFLSFHGGDSIDQSGSSEAEEQIILCRACSAD